MSRSIISFCAPIFLDIIRNNRCLFFVIISESWFPANVLQTQRGNPRIHHDGYTFGLHNTATIYKKRNTWCCTRTGVRWNGVTGRCLAKIETKYVSDKMMLRVKDPDHMCSQKND